MNPLLHFLVSYIFVEIIFKNAKENLILILISSTFLDLDHILYILKKKEKILNDRFGAESRSIFHELLGMLIFSFIISFLYLILDKTLVRILYLSLFLHYAIDFLSGKSRPLYPYSRIEIQLISISSNSRIISEIILTIFSFIIFCGMIL